MKYKENYKLNYIQIMLGFQFFLFENYISTYFMKLIDFN
jgi:hypothetical protein